MEFILFSFSLLMFSAILGESSNYPYAHSILFTPDAREYMCVAGRPLILVVLIKVPSQHPYAGDHFPAPDFMTMHRILGGMARSSAIYLIDASYE